MTQETQDYLATEVAELQKNYKIEMNLLEGNPVAQRRLGTEHLKFFDKWVNELRAHLESTQTAHLSERETASHNKNIEVIKTWDAHMRTLDIQNTEEDIRLFKLDSIFKLWKRAAEHRSKVEIEQMNLWKAEGQKRRHEMEAARRLRAAGQTAEE